MANLLLARLSLNSVSYILLSWLDNISWLPFMKLACTSFSAVLFKHPVSIHPRGVLTAYGCFHLPCLSSVYSMHFWHILSNKYAYCLLFFIKSWELYSLQVRPLTHIFIWRYTSLRNGKRINGPHLVQNNRVITIKLRQATIRHSISVWDISEAKCARLTLCSPKVFSLL